MNAIVSAATLGMLAWTAAGTDGPVNLARDAADARPSLTVDSTYAGYGHDVLTDGQWIELGREVASDVGDRDYLGNCGNSWVSAATAAAHWVRMDWPRPVTVNQVAICWTQPAWHPKAFRVEILRDGAWVPASGTDDWLVPTEQRSTVIFPAMTAASWRIKQPARGGPDRGFLAIQEIAVFHQSGEVDEPRGARPLTFDEARRLEPERLERNLARLHVAQPGADAALAWTDAGASVAQAELHDGDHKTPVTLAPGAMPGVRWPIPHVCDGGAVSFASAASPESLPVVQIHDGEAWRAWEAGLRAARDPARARLVLSWEPVATTAVRLAPPVDWPAITEIELYRHLPAGLNEWPERLVSGNRFEREMLAGGREPSYAALCTAALSMTPAHALLGLKDAVREIGVAWDGAIVSRWPIRLSFGAPPEPLAAYRDTVVRHLIDGWRPGVIVEGRLRDLRITQTAFVSFAGPNRTAPALFLRTVLENVGMATLRTAVHARVETGSAKPESRDVAVVAEGHAALVGGGDEDWGATIDGELVQNVELAPGARRSTHLIQPWGDGEQPQDVGVYRRADHDEALREFHRYWDQIQEAAALIDVPEPHVVNMYRAVLTQLLINADGDTMPYGSDPSWYAGRLYGIEEGYAMIALAQVGLLGDAQRYLDGTYLTPEFLVKTPRYTKYADRHQQYRNGLQPHYAVTAYRLGRDRAWIAKHLPLLRQCAEWTMAERRKTQTLENGARPLHYGLLPKWSYGGDISDLQCYALYANFACWKGLVDTAWLLGELGDHDTATRYRADADDYRRSIVRAVEGNYRPDHDPPFLPLQLYADRLVGDDYDQLFAGTLLHLQPWDPTDRQLAYVTEFLERDNRTFCLLPRFRRDVGAGGLDGLYGLGYILTKLRQDRIDEFLLGFYGYLAFNLERGTFAARETNLIYASDVHARSRYDVPDKSDPVPCAAAVAVQLLRHMLATELRPAPDRAADRLRLLGGAPRSWFADGRTIRARRLPTEFGELDLEVVSRAATGRIEARVAPPLRDRWSAIELRLRDPRGHKLARVTVNGRPLASAAFDRDLIPLEPGPDVFHVIAELAGAPRQ